MELELTPLDDAALPPAVRKSVAAVAPPQVRMMVARGMAPMEPAAQVTALYQLAHGEDEAIREIAAKTARELPDPVLAVALAGPLDPRVLDFFGRAVVTRARLVSVVLSNHATDDRTFVALAQMGGEQVVEQIALNEQRLLRHAPIITALYLNRRTRTSTALRALELAVRAGVVVEGIPSYEDVKAAIQEEGAPTNVDDIAFEAALDPAILVVVQSETPEEDAINALAEAAEKRAEEIAMGERTDERTTGIANLPMAAKLRLAAIGGAFARAQLVRDSNKVVAIAAVRSPALTEQEAERYAGNRSLHEEVVRYLATQRAFTKRYSVKMNLVSNPKCPLSLAVGFLSHLTAKDLRQVSRSKSVSSALTKAAQNLLDKRGPR